MQITDKDIIAGQAVYTKNVLAAYDIIVLGISNRFIWKCPSRRLLAHYNRHISSNHLDVGVGTGYFLDRCRFPSECPRVALMDMNANTLAFASTRITRYKPETYKHNVFEKIASPVKPFDSVGVNYLFHCLPGSFGEKSVVFDHLAPLMNPGAILFGATILHHGIKRHWAARKLMALYNKKGIFSNTGDDLDGLKTALSRRFTDISVDTVGCVALFSGRAG